MQHIAISCAMAMLAISAGCLLKVHWLHVMQCTAMAHPRAHSNDSFASAICLLEAQDSDRFWHVPPPAAEALEHVLRKEEVVVAFAWSILRSNPAVSSHGGPLCHGTTNVTLSPQSRSEVLDILQVSGLDSQFPQMHFSTSPYPD